MKISVRRFVNKIKYVGTCDECQTELLTPPNQILKDGFIKCPNCQATYKIDKDEVQSTINFWRSTRGGKGLEFD